MTNSEKDLIQRAQDIQRFTENRCNVLEERNAKLEKENAELRNRNSELAGQKASLERWYGEAKEILTKLLEEEKHNMYWEMNGSDRSSYYEVRKQAEQFLKDSEVNK